MTNKEEKNVTHEMVMKALEWGYDKAINPPIGLDSAQELAESYLKESGTLEEKINSLIRWQNSKSATSGFVTNLGGLVTMPIGIPANLTSVLYIQIRMVAAIAYMCGYDVKSDQVKTMVYMSLCGTALAEVLKNAGIQISKKLTAHVIKNVITGQTIKAINKAVGFRLFTKAGEKGVINLTRTIPFFSGLVGGTFDLITTNTIGNTARDLFLGKQVD